MKILTPFIPVIRQPNKLSLVLTRRSRRFATTEKSWEPTIRNPYRGLVVWSKPEPLELTVTLFRDQRDQHFDDKDYVLNVEDVSVLGRRRRVATATINFSNYADGQSTLPTRHEITKLRLHTSSKKLVEAHVTFSLTCQFLKEGSAT